MERVGQVSSFRLDIAVLVAPVQSSAYEAKSALKPLALFHAWTVHRAWIFRVS
jgi:hypothetical protein